MDKLLTIPQVAAILQISKAKIYNLAKKNKIPHIKIEKNIRIRESELIKWLQSQEVKGDGDVWYTSGW